jgi:hypothetical protein
MSGPNHSSRELAFDFDEWAQLADESPEAFEDRRQALLRSAIDSAAPDRRQRLQAMQWRLDQVRRRAGTPLAASLALYAMMWDAVLGENGLRDSLMGAGRGETPERTAAGEGADILPFRPPSTRRP